MDSSGEVPPTVWAAFQQSGFRDQIAASLGGRMPASAKDVKKLRMDPEVHKAMNKVLTQADEPDPIHGYSNANYPHQSTASHPACLEKCDICADQWRTPFQVVMLDYQRNYTDQEAKDIVQERKTNAANNLNYVRTALDKHGDFIMKAWQRRSPAQRAVLLRQAMPDIYPRKGFPMNELNKLTKRVPDFGKTRRGAGRGAMRLGAPLDDKFHKNFLLPYLDTESLSQSESAVLALLYNRTRFKPSDWALLDSHLLGHLFQDSFLRAS